MASVIALIFVQNRIFYGIVPLSWERFVGFTVLT
jgi:hypothetical protein